MQKVNILQSRKRRERDIAKLKQNGFKLLRVGDSEIHVDLVGPKETLYEGGIWRVQVHIPTEYPFKSPSIGFKDQIFHPNIDFQSGSICLDVINQTWTPMYELFNVFEVFLPQLLAYPNVSDPLNVEAANLSKEDKEVYEKTVRKMVFKHAVNGKELERGEQARLELERQRAVISQEQRMSPPKKQSKIWVWEYVG